MTRITKMLALHQQLKHVTENKIDHVDGHTEKMMLVLKKAKKEVKV